MPEPCDYGHFVVRLDQRLVLVDGQPASLGGRAFDVLRVLLERSERVVTKEELMELVWPGVIVEENNLTVHISALRKLLGARVITTVAGRGYQFTPGSREAPARAAAATRTDAASTAGAATTAAAVPRLSTRGRLLVAEDNRVNRLLLVRSLELLGHQVVAVDDGRKALEALRAQRFDLLLLDLGMPEMNGFDVLEAMAGDPELREVPVVVTSAVEAVEKVARCIELGADDYLHKPVDPVLLRARVASSLEKARLREQQRELIQRLMVADMGTGRGTAQTLAPGAASVTATVLAVKLRAVASAAMALPASDVVGWLDECHTLWRDAIANHGGVTLGECGGTLLAVFGLASASAADPAVTKAPTTAQARLAAARAALDMAEMQDLFNAERTAAGRMGSALAVGIASGEVKVGTARTDERAGRVCLGSPVESALGLACQAGDAEGEAREGADDGHSIWIDATTHAALHGRVAAQALPVRADPPARPPREGGTTIYALKTS